MAEAAVVTSSGLSRTSGAQFLVLPSPTYHRNTSPSSGAFPPPASRSPPAIPASDMKLFANFKWAEGAGPQPGTTRASCSGEPKRPLSREKTLPTRSMPMAISEEEEDGGRDVAAKEDESTLQPAPVAYMYDQQHRRLILWIWAQDADVCRSDGSSRPSPPPIQIEDQHFTYRWERPKAGCYDHPTVGNLAMSCILTVPNFTSNNRLKCSGRKTLCVDLHLAHRVASTPVSQRVGSPSSLYSISLFVRNAFTPLTLPPTPPLPHHFPCSARCASLW